MPADDLDDAGPLRALCDLHQPERPQRYARAAAGPLLAITGRVARDPGGLRHPDQRRGKPGGALMALPFSFSSELKWPDHLNARLGPFESGGNLYAVLCDKTANTLEVWKSTDGGNSWAEQDAANHKSAYNAPGHRCA